MPVVDPGAPGPDLYRLLGVAREASRADIAQAWRRRARAAHPDARPGDAAAPDRFHALAVAWHVLGDPDRRAAYDRAFAREQTPSPASRPAGSQPFASQPNGPQPNGSEPNGSESTGSESTGSESTGSESTGSYPAGSRPAAQPAARMPGPPPLWAGPVLVEGPHQAPVPGPSAGVDIRLAVLALRFLARERGRDWDW